MRKKKVQCYSSKNIHRTTQRVSLLKIHEEKMNNYINKNVLNKEYDTKLNKIKQEINVLKKSIALNSMNNTVINNDDVYFEIRKLEYAQTNLINNKQYFNTLEETNYLLNVSDYVSKYYELDEKEKLLLLDEDLNDIELTQINVDKRDIFNSYMLYIDPNHNSGKNQVSDKEIQYCKECKIYLEIHEGHGVCNQCGLSVPIVHQATELSYKELQEVAYRPQFTYEKSSHLAEWLRRFCAKENKEIPQDIIAKVILEANKEKIRDLNVLTEKQVKKYLKKLNLSNYYDNVISIINKINGRPAFILTEQINNKIHEMFQKIQEPFLKFKNGLRLNMLSYSYLLNKFFFILKLPEFASYFLLLKSEEKLRMHDETFKKIVDYLAEYDTTIEWKFYSSF